jgi:hypothetical protein
VFGLRGEEGVALRRFQAWRQALPTAASPLERGDDEYGRGQYAEALNSYRRQAATAGAGRDVLDEAHYKEALCLLALQRAAEALPLFEWLGAEAESRWSILASCQHWLLLLRQDRFDEASLRFERLTARYRFADLAASIPDDVRQDILTAYYERTANVNLYRPDPQRVLKAEQGRAVEDFFHTTGPSPGLLTWTLYRTYHAVGQLDKARAVLEERLRHLGPATVMTNESVMEYSWLLRLLGRTRQALEEVDRRLFEKPGTYRPSALMMLLERARIQAALGQWDQAEHDIEDLFRLSPPQALNGRHRVGAQLLRGLLRERRGDKAGARAAWHQDDEALDHLDVRFGFEFLSVLMMASLADELPDARADAVMKRVAAELSARDDRFGGAFTRLIHFPPGVLREMWRTPRGRDYAAKIGFQSISFADIIAASPCLLLTELVRQGAWQGPYGADDEELFWGLTQDLFRSFAAAELGNAQLVALGLTWKGSSGFLGWGGLAPKLAPERRGRMAYIFGQRYARALHKPDEAAAFFRTALADAGPNDRLRRLAQTELDRLKAK